MIPEIKHTPQILDAATQKDFLKVEETESLAVYCQKFDGPHMFRHINELHDEILYVISGEMDVWTEAGSSSLKAGDLIRIPRGMEHGDLNGRKVEILIIEGKL